METHYTHTRKIQHCKTCSAKCEEDKPIVGCCSIMVPTRPFTAPNGKTYDRFCDRRVWFDKNYYPVKFYRWPTEEEINTLSEKEWDMTLAEELKKIQGQA